MRRHSPLSSIALLALLVALLMRAGIPAGYMLASADGMPRIVPCDGIAPVAAHHNGHHDKHDRSPETPCAFALVAPPFMPGGTPALAPPPAAPSLLAAAATVAAAPRPRAILPPPATGPPSA